MDNPTGTGRDIVAIGGSAGGLDALEALLMRLPPDLPAAALAVLHRPTGRASFLPEILAPVMRMPIALARKGQSLDPGMCYLGQPDGCLTIGPGPTFHLLPDSFYRARNIDALFQPLAYHAGARPHVARPRR